MSTMWWFVWLFVIILAIDEISSKIFEDEVDDDTIICDGANITNITSFCGECDEYDIICPPTPPPTPSPPVPSTCCSDDGCAPPTNVYVIFYYDRFGQVAFKAAARTKKNEILTDPAYNSATDCVMMLPFTFEADFKNQWKSVTALAGGTVKEAYIYGHSSKGCVAPLQDGIEFPGGTLTQAEIGALDVLPWQKAAKLYIHSCSSGVKGKRGWSIASDFAKRQGINVYGEPGPAVFSTNLKKYSSIPCDEEKVNQLLKVYLRAYHRGFWGNGNRMTLICEPPPRPPDPKARTVPISPLYENENIIPDSKHVSIVSVMIYAGILLFILVDAIFICYWCMCREAKHKSMVIKENE